MDIGSLHAWKQALEKEIEELEAKVSPLQIEIHIRREKLAAIDRLLHLEEEPSVAASIATQKDIRGSTGEVLDVAYDILKKRGEPLHYKELYGSMRDRGLSLNGKDPATNLIAKIGRDRRFERVGRGTYALAEWRLGRKRRVAR